MNRKLIALVALGMLGLVLASVVSASAASNTVPQSRAGEHLRAITANDLKPTDCASLNLAAVLSGSGTFGGTSASELILGGQGDDNINGDAGDDCVLAGAGNDNLIGGLGTDVCLGGSGADTYDPSCETKVDPVGICSSPGSQTIVTDRDSSIRQGQSALNFGTNQNLDVSSETNKNMRTLVGFSLPNLPSGCSISSATLRVFNKAPTGGQTIEARRITASWTETGVTWRNQPTVVDPAATSTSPSSASYQTWTVTTQIANMYSSGNHGFMLRDQVESSPTVIKQGYRSREDLANRPAELVVEWR